MWPPGHILGVKNPIPAAPQSMVLRDGVDKSGGDFGRVCRALRFHPPRIPLSSPGLTGRSSFRQVLDARFRGHDNIACGSHRASSIQFSNSHDLSPADLRRRGAFLSVSPLKEGDGAPGGASFRVPRFSAFALARFGET